MEIIKDLMINLKMINLKMENKMPIKMLTTKTTKRKVLGPLMILLPQITPQISLILHPLQMIALQTVLIAPQTTLIKQMIKRN